MEFRSLFFSLILIVFTPQSYGSSNNYAVVSYHPQATAIGDDIIKTGGNAFDAFVAITAAQYVLSEGVTSLGGPLGALLYDAKSKKVIYMDAGFNTPLDTRKKFDPAHSFATAGAAALVPGAPAGLEAISKKYGRLSFAVVLQPAINLARNGFVANKLLAL